MAEGAQGIRKQVIIKKQTALGSVASGSGGQILRRNTGTGTATRNMLESSEIVSHHQSTGGSYGGKSAAYKLDGILSAATYKLWFAALLENDFAAVSAYAAGIDVSADSSGTFTDASGGYLTAGLKVGMVGRWTGWSTTSNNSRNFWITVLTATVMTGIFLDGTAVTTDAGGASDNVTFTPVGKFSKPPLTGHTDDYYTVEDFYQDKTFSDLFGDCKVGQIAVGLSADANSSFAADLVCLSRTKGTAQILTSPTAETSTGIMSAINGKLYVNGSSMGNVSNLQLTVANGAANAGFVIGSNNSPSVSKGRIKVSGTFSAMFDSQAIQTLYDAETAVSLMAVLAADETATSDFMGFTLGKIKITDDAPDDGEKTIMRTYPFTAEINRAGGTALAWDDTIITVQDSAA